MNTNKATKDDMGFTETLDAMNSQITDLVRQRNNLLRKLRLECEHNRLVELMDAPPQRICADCGAEEQGWHCGYQILVMRGDTFAGHSAEKRVLIQVTSDSRIYYSFRKNGPLYLVGQSHPNFGPGRQTYKQLTEIPGE